MVIKQYFALFCLSIITFCSCKKFIEVDPPSDQLPTASVFTNDAAATAAALGMYSEMMQDISVIFNGELTWFGGMSADELVNSSLSSITHQEFYANSISPNNSGLKREFWDAAYRYIYQANALIEGLNKTAGVTESLKKQLEGEARFVRAFSHFYLTNLFGNIPYVKTTDYRENSRAGKIGVSQVYDEVVSDLISAQDLLSANHPSAERVRPNKAVANALLARVYLYKEDWSNAETQASALIGDPAYSLLPDLNTVFLRESRETIWHMIPLSTELNTAEGYRFGQLVPGVPSYAYMTTDMVNAFEANDNRKAQWVNSYVYSGQPYNLPHKYKVRTSPVLLEYNIVLRLAEQYLVRAEARAQQNNIAGAQADLNSIRNRAGLPNTTAADKTSLLLAVEQERRIEFFVEWGHRWLDLKRTGRAHAVLSAVKGAGWQATDVLYPIPQFDILNNSNLAPQNAGY